MEAFGRHINGWLLGPRETCGSSQLCCESVAPWTCARRRPGRGAPGKIFYLHRFGSFRRQGGDKKPVSLREVVSEETQGPERQGFIDQAARYNPTFSFSDRWNSGITTRTFHAIQPVRTYVRRSAHVRELGVRGGMPAQPPHFPGATEQWARDYCLGPSYLQCGITYVSHPGCWVAALKKEGVSKNTDSGGLGSGGLGGSALLCLEGFCLLSAAPFALPP